LRRSRERIKEGDRNAKATLYYVLKTISKLIAPFIPFTAEEIWQKLKNENDEESVHLAEWPHFAKASRGKPNFIKKLFGKSNKVIEEMQKAREIVSLGLQLRQKAGIPVRQPLSELRITNYKLREEYFEIVKEEMNVKEIKLTEGKELKVEIDTNITPELKEEGNYRELVRAIQEMRKKAGLTPSDIISISFDTNEEGKNLIQKFEKDMKKTILAEKIEFKNNNGEEIKIGDMVFKLSIKK